MIRDLLEAQDENPFRAGACRRAAMHVGTMPDDVETA